jgi:hypothetical protein
MKTLSQTYSAVKGRTDRAAHDAKVAEGSAYRAWMVQWQKNWAHRWEVHDGRYYLKGAPK